MVQLTAQTLVISWVPLQSAHFWEEVTEN